MGAADWSRAPALLWPVEKFKGTAEPFPLNFLLMTS